MNSENIKKVTNQAIEQLIDGAEGRAERDADAVSCRRLADSIATASRT